MQYDKFSWDDFLEVTHNRDLILFGAAETGRKFYSTYHDMFNIIAVFDNSSEKWNKNLGGIPICDPEGIVNLNIEKIVCVITSQYWYEIIEQIRGYGVQYYFVYPAIEDNCVNMIYEKCERPQYKYQWDIPFCCYAHALGVVDGIKYTNSEEAFQNSILNGFNIFELDLSLVNGQLIGFHGRDCFTNIYFVDGRSTQKNIYNTYDENGWIADYKDLQEQKIFGKYTPLKFKDICNKMVKNKNIYFFIDIKYRSLDERMKLFIELEKELKQFDKSIRERFVIQVFSESMFREAENILNVKYYVMLFEYRTMKRMLNESLKCGINTLIVHHKEVDECLLDFFHEKGYKIGVHGMKDKKQIARCRRLGVDIFCVEDVQMMEEL